MKQKPLLEKVKGTIHSYGMLTDGDRVIVGVSGGADSICLLDLLQEMQKEIRFDMRVVHVHHGLRETADRDERYVKEFCSTRKIKCTAVHVDAAGYARSHRESVEEAGRHLRQQAFADAAETWNREEPSARPVKVALAHHEEDLAETVLFNLCRGTGLAGLRGIQPVAENRIRPLIACARNEIEEWLISRGISWEEDETNADPDITRNYLRREVLPMLSRQVNTAVIPHIAHLAREVSDVEAYLSELTKERWEHCRVNTATGRAGRSALSVTKLSMEPAFLQRRILMELLAEAAGRRKDLGDAHVETLQRLLSKQGSGQADLPYGLTAHREYDAFWIEPKIPEVNKKAGERQAAFPKTEQDYEMRVFRYDGVTRPPADKYTKWFDYDKMTAFPVFRTRQPGDRIVISDQGLSKSIARYMIDAKIPKELRDRYVIPAKEQEILWIPGYQMNAAYKITETTKRVLEISWTRESLIRGAEMPEDEENHG